jgi:hypothetical protein
MAAAYSSSPQSAPVSWRGRKVDGGGGGALVSAVAMGSPTRARTDNNETRRMQRVMERLMDVVPVN